MYWGRDNQRAVVRTNAGGNLARGKTLTRLAALATLSAVRERGYDALSSKLLSRTAGEEGPSPHGSAQSAARGQAPGLVGEGAAGTKLQPCRRYFRQTRRRRSVICGRICSGIGVEPLACFHSAPSTTAGEAR